MSTVYAIDRLLYGTDTIPCRLCQRTCALQPRHQRPRRKYHGLRVDRCTIRFTSPHADHVYDMGFSGTQPIPGIALDPFTGQLSFTPTVTGNYVVVMKVTTYDTTGMVIGTIMRDFIVVVVNCMGEPPQTTGPAISANGTLDGHVLEVCDGVPFCMEFPFSDADLGGVVSH
jgi:hypothetical protein